MDNSLRPLLLIVMGISLYAMFDAWRSLRQIEEAAFLHAVTCGIPVEPCKYTGQRIG